MEPGASRRLRHEVAGADHPFAALARNTNNQIVSTHLPSRPAFCPLNAEYRPGECASIGTGNRSAARVTAAPQAGNDRRGIWGFGKAFWGRMAGAAPFVNSPVVPPLHAPLP
jgi:hypothetical protein